MEHYSNIQKIALAETEDFVAEYVVKQKPVIITDLFANQGIAELKNKEDTLARWHNLKLKVQLEYMEDYKAQYDDQPSKEKIKVSETVEMTYAEYDCYVKKHPNTKMMCIEFGTPEDVANAYDTPTFCFPDETESDSIVNQIFIGNKGNYASLHFDRAGFNGLLYQVYGRKRVLLFPHESSTKLIPLNQICGWSINNFTPEDYQSFLKFTKGVEIILQPGECLYMPVLCWHYVDYLDDCMSINYRFKRKEYIAEVLSDLYPDYISQGICQKLLKLPEAERSLKLKELNNKVTQAIEAGGSDGVKIVEDLKVVARKFHSQLYPELPKKAYTMNFDRHMPTVVPEFLDALSSNRPRYA